MTPEDFIKNNPFPKNGTEINNALVRDIQDPRKKSKYKENVQKLLKNNARVIYLVWKQYNYNQSIGSIMSFVYEGIEVTAREYKIGSAKPYYSYLMTYVRGLLQKYYNYNESLVHVPVMKKKDFSVDLTEINNVSEFVAHSDGVDPMEEEMDDLLAEYGSQKLPEKIREDFEITKLSRYMTVKEISDRTGLGIGKIRNIIKRTVPRLRNFYNKTFINT
jgi:hypothetical protein